MWGQVDFYVVKLNKTLVPSLAISTSIVGIATIISIILSNYTIFAFSYLYIIPYVGIKIAENIKIRQGKKLEETLDVLKKQRFENIKQKSKYNKESIEVKNKMNEYLVKRDTVKQDKNLDNNPVKEIEPEV